MKNLKQKRQRYLWKTVVLPGLVCCCLVTALFFGLREFAAVGDEQDAELVQISLQRAAVQCYACEGMYPPSFDYLVENYYVTVDETKYGVDYDIFASNMMPNIFVYPR